MKIKTFEQACAKTGTDPLDPRFTTGSSYCIALEKLIEIAKAVNEGWAPNWDNGSERKWFPWFWMGSPGFRLGDALYDYTHSITTGGSRLCFKSEAIAEHVGETFIELYKELFGAK